MKTGDYARTKSGIIGKLIIKEDTIAVAKWQGGYELQDTTTYIISDEKVYKNEIIKSSPNIIDLIEVGDYLNGWRVEELERSTDNSGTILKVGIMTFNVLDNEKIYLPKHNDNELEQLELLKNIVTKEQFSQMEYKL